MKTAAVSRYIGAGLAALLTACSANGSSPMPVTNAAPLASRILNVATLMTQPGVRPRSRGVPATTPFLRPNCCARRKTLLVTDAFGGSSFTGAVYVFDYETAQLLGQLPAPPDGWLEVQGACVDNRGHAYFANTALSTIEEYTHAGKYVATLADPGQFPVGCAYDRTTGNLAVSNIIDTSGGPGSISIYHGGVLQNTYIPPNMSRVYDATFQDNSGVLWLSGSDSSGIFLIDTFYNGTFKRLKITGVGGGPSIAAGDLQWSAKTNTMNVSGTDASGDAVLWHVTPAGKVVGKTILTCPGSPSSSCSIGAFFIKGPRVATVSAATFNVYLFDYPQGGDPIKSYAGPYVQPIGIAISS